MFVYTYVLLFMLMLIILCLHCCLGSKENMSISMYVHMFIHGTFVINIHTQLMVPVTEAGLHAAPPSKPPEAGGISYEDEMIDRVVERMEGKQAHWQMIASSTEFTLNSSYSRNVRKWALIQDLE